MATKGPRAGYGSVTPRMVVTDVAGQVDFLRSVFGGTGSIEPGLPAEIHIGDSLVLVSSAGDRDLFPAFLYMSMSTTPTKLTNGRSRPEPRP